MRTVTMKKLIDDGYADRLCPAHDCICLHILNERADGTLPEEHALALRNPDGYLYMHRHVIPHLKSLGVGDDVIDTLFVHNPQRFFAGG